MINGVINKIDPTNRVLTLQKNAKAGGTKAKIEFIQ